MTHSMQSTQTPDVQSVKQVERRLYAKTRSIRSAVSIQYRLVTDTQRQTPGHTALA